MNIYLLQKIDSYLNKVVNTSLNLVPGELYWLSSRESNKEEEWGAYIVITILTPFAIDKEIDITVINKLIKEFETILE